MATYRPLARHGDSATYVAVEDSDWGDGGGQEHGSHSGRSSSRRSSWLHRWLSCLAVSGAAALLLLLLPSLPSGWAGSWTSAGAALCGALLLPPFSPLSPRPSPSPSPSPLPCSAVTLRDELRYLTHSEHLELLRSAGQLPAVAEPSLVVVGMTGSAKGRQRMRTAMDTWMRHSISRRSIFFSDVDDAALRMVALPSMRDRVGYGDAQHRQLRGLRWLFNATTPTTRLNGSVYTPPYTAPDVDHLAEVADEVATGLRRQVVEGAVEWVLFADDDTFVNVPALLSLLRENAHSRHLPIIIGNVFDRVTRTFDLSYCVGGAGFVMTSHAARAIARALYTDACPFVEFNDDSVGDCAMRLNITNVHSALFQNGMDFSTFRYLEMRPLKQASITWHYATDPVARQLQAEIDRRQAMLSNCSSHAQQR